MTEQEVWTIWVEEQIHREGVEKFKEWYDAQMRRTGNGLHPELIDTYERMFNEKC